VRKTIVRGFAGCAVLASLVCAPASPAVSDGADAVKATHPLAYFRFEATLGKSETGASQYHAVGNVRAWPGGVQVGDAAGYYALLDGRTGTIETTQSGGIASSASIMAWVILRTLPSGLGHVFYVAGESESGNDLDLQIEANNQLVFWSGTGGPIHYAPPPDKLVGHWHMIAATIDGATGHRALYWDGAPVAGDNGGKGMKPKTKEFTIGDSNVFNDRFLDGGIDDTALWNVALTPAQVKAIYAASKTSADWTSAGAPPLAMCTKAAPAGAKPIAVTLPAYLGFLPGMEAFLDTNSSTWDEVAFPPGPWGDGSNTKRGKRLHLYGAMADDCTAKKLAFDTLKSGFESAGWKEDKEFDSQPFMGILRYNKDGTEAWAQIAISQPPKVEMQIIEVGPPPISLTLSAPASVPEKVVPEKGDFPYLAPLPGSKFKGGQRDPSPFTVLLPGADKAEIVAAGTIDKSYQPPDGLSLLAWQTVYHGALLKAGWTIVSEFRSADAAITVHYGQNGRNIWAYLHINADGYSISVSDTSAGTSGIAADLAKECHVALTGVLFDFNKSTLKPESDAVLQRVADVLAKDPTLLKLEVQGHTDNVGSDSYNQTLSEARAQAVVAWLTQHGVAAGRLSAAGYGKTRPVADNGTDQGRAKNRRVEIANPACQPKGK
jgi:outer membrane protein OmpA-like peptidoglycan-associated protein